MQTQNEIVREKKKTKRILRFQHGSKLLIAHLWYRPGFFWLWISDSCQLSPRMVLYPRQTC